MSLLYAAPHMQRSSEVPGIDADKVHKSSKKKKGGVSLIRAIFFGQNYVSEQSANLVEYGMACTCAYKKEAKYTARWKHTQNIKQNVTQSYVSGRLVCSAPFYKNSVMTK